MDIFQINVLIRFLTSSTYFELQGFINRKTVCIRSFCMVCFSCIYVSSTAGGRVFSIHTVYSYINARKTYHTKTAGRSCLIYDKPMRFEICRKRQKSN